MVRFWVVPILRWLKTGTDYLTRKSNTNIIFYNKFLLKIITTAKKNQYFQQQKATLTEKQFNWITLIKNRNAAFYVTCNEMPCSVNAVLDIIYVYILNIKVSRNLWKDNNKRLSILYLSYMSDSFISTVCHSNPKAIITKCNYFTLPANFRFIQSVQSWHYSFILSIYIYYGHISAHVRNVLRAKSFTELL